jgi:hypothetical protein
MSNELILIQGLISGIVLAMIYYGKEGGLPKVNSASFATIVLIGILTGVFMIEYDVDYGTATNMLTQMGVITLIDQGMKAIYRWLKGKGFDVIPEKKKGEAKLNGNEKLNDRVKGAYQDFLDGVVKLSEVKLLEDEKTITVKLGELADKYQAFLDEVEQRNKGFKESYLMDLSGRLKVKQKDIPAILRSGDLTKANEILRIFLLIQKAKLEKKGGKK